MFYTEKKLEDNQICLRREIIKMLLAALPFLAVCVVGFAARNQTVCTIGLVLACAAVIFVGDLFVAPVVRYGKFLRDLFSGLTRKTAGTLVRVGEDDIYENGVIFHEMIVNIYEDMTPEGERRFLIEPAMPLDTALIGRDVAVTTTTKWFWLSSRLEQRYEQGETLLRAAGGKNGFPRMRFCCAAHADSGYDVFTECAYAASNG